MTQDRIDLTERLEGVITADGVGRARKAGRLRAILADVLIKISIDDLDFVLSEMASMGVGEKLSEKN